MADLVVLDKDIMTIGEDEILTTEVVMTIPDRVPSATREDFY
jgi:predicted amidohydrolase YtcJ